MKKSILTVIIAGTALAGCGGGGGSSTTGTTATGAVTGVEVPSNMSVVSAQGSGQVSGVLIDYNAVAGVLHENADTDYSSDPVSVWVWDDSLEALQLVNQILCYVGQTAADQMVNAGGNGEYTALINEDKCEQGQNTDAGTGQSSGQATQFNMWTVKSTRASNSEPQLIKLWVPPARADDYPILVEITAYEGVSASAPFGSFRLNFKGVDPQGVTRMTGSLFTVDANTDPSSVNASGNPQFKLINLRDDQMCEGGPCVSGQFAMKTNVVFNDGTGSSGTARTYMGFEPNNASDPGFSSQYAIAFDSNFMLREGTTISPQSATPQTNQICSDRNDFNTTVWRSNLYYSGNNLPAGASAGQRVAVNSGFPITVDVNGETEYGWIGYWGLWLPESVDTSSLTTVTRDEFGSTTNPVYDLVQAPGKLIKSESVTVALADMDGVSFNYFDPNSGNDFLVEYTVDNTLSDGSTMVAAPGFYMVARMMSPESGGGSTADLNGDGNPDAPVDITPAQGEWLGMWSQGLGGNINYTGGDTVVTYFKETFVNSSTAIAELFSTTNDPDGDGVVSFKCYTQCLKANIAQTDLDNETFYQIDSMSPATPAVTYYFKRSDLTLYDGDPASGGQPVTLTSGAAPQPGSPNEWGVATGAFVMSGVTLANVWDAFNESVSYRWETGSNAWNRSFAVKEQGSGNFVEFEPPLQISYQFSAVDDANAGGNFAGSEYYGQTFLLEYSGQGELGGIPWQQNGQRWSSAFTIADGTLLGDGDMYVLKGIEKEQTMREASDPSSCASLAVPSDTNLPLPTAAEVGTVSLTAADEPVVTDAPAVIEGVVQGS